MKKHYLLKGILTSIIATIIVVTIVYAATTIGTNISTDGDISTEGNITAEGTLTIDVDSSSALLVRKDGDGGNVFYIDTIGDGSQSIVGLFDSLLYMTAAEGKTVPVYFVRNGSLSDGDYIGALNFNDQSFNGIATIIARVDDTTPGAIDGSLLIANSVNGSLGLNYTFGSTFTSERGVVIDMNDPEAFLVRRDSDGGDVLTVNTDSEITTLSGDLISSDTGDLGWSVQSQADQACNTTCTNACVFGFDEDASTVVGCSDATADKCICAGSS